MEPPFCEKEKLSELLNKWHLLVYSANGFNHCFHHTLHGGHQKHQLISGTLCNKCHPYTSLFQANILNILKFFYPGDAGQCEGRMTFNQLLTFGRVKERARALIVSHPELYNFVEKHHQFSERRATLVRRDINFVKGYTIRSICRLISQVERVQQLFVWMPEEYALGSLQP